MQQHHALQPSMYAKELDIEGKRIKGCSRACEHTHVNTHDGKKGGVRPAMHVMFNFEMRIEKANLLLFMGENFTRFMFILPIQNEAITVNRG